MKLFKSILLFLTGYALFLTPPLLMQFGVEPLIGMAAWPLAAWLTYKAGKHSASYLADGIGEGIESGLKSYAASGHFETALTTAWKKAWQEKADSATTLAEKHFFLTLGGIQEQPHFEGKMILTPSGSVVESSGDWIVDRNILNSFDSLMAEKSGVLTDPDWHSQFRVTTRPDGNLEVSFYSLPSTYAL